MQLLQCRSGAPTTAIETGRPQRKPPRRPGVAVVFGSGSAWVPPPLRATSPTSISSIYFHIFHLLPLLVSFSELPTIHNHPHLSTFVHNCPHLWEGVDDDERFQNLQDDPRYFPGAQLGKAKGTVFAGISKVCSLTFRCFSSFIASARRSVLPWVKSFQLGRTLFLTALPRHWWSCPAQN